MTVKNEADSLPRLFETLSLQTTKPDEIIIADGGSTDNTLMMLRAAPASLGLRVLERPGTNISEGRNAAISQTDAEVIASLDAGVRLDPQWLENIIRPFSEANSPQIVSGFFLPDPQGAFETALAATTLPALQDIRPDSFLPSSRSVAYLKGAWQQVNGYPEWLDYCEDVVFDLELKRAGFRFQFVPEATVHFRPRTTLAKFFRQYYLYARGDGKAGLWPLRHLARYLTYLVAIPFSFAIFWAAPFLSLIIWIVGAIGLFGTPYRRLFTSWRELPFADKLRALLWVPLIRISGDFAKMIGYPVGVWWRFKHRPQLRQTG